MLKSTGKMKEMFDGICLCEFGRPSFSIDLSTSRSNEEIESKGAQDVSVEISAVLTGSVSCVRWMRSLCS